MISLESVWQRFQEMDRRNPYFTTGVATIFFTIFLILDLQVKPAADSGFVQEDTLGVILAFLQVLPILFFRKAPLAALSIIFLAFVAHATFDYDTPWVVQFSTMVGLYVVTSTTDDRQSIVAGLLTVSAIVIVFGVIQEKTDNAIALVLLFIAIWIAGNVVRSRRGRLEVAELTVAELSEEQERAARDAVRGERSRIARELHDVLGHALNLVVIQAGAAQRVYESSPEKAMEAVKSIESTSRQALSDVDRMLGILRDPDESSNPAPSLEARPSLSRIGGLVTELNSTGQPIKLKISGGVSNLVPSTDLTAYRVVQEALTNVMTHAAGSNSQVEIDYGTNQLTVTITNDSSGTDTLAGRKTGGRGIVGMRERTALFGGDFKAGATGDGGWRVRATFPINRSNNDGNKGESQ